MITPISVVIIAKNEEKRLPECIKSVAGWADEIIVVDDESTDQTREIAKSLGAKVFIRKMENEGIHRNWAYAQTKNEWVFSVDCDERPTEELKKEISQVIADPKHNFYDIPFRTYIGDYWIRWGGWYPGPKVKLFKKSKFKYEEVEVHPRIFAEGKAGHLKNDVIHYSYRDFTDFLTKTNKQTTWEAKKWFDLTMREPHKAKTKMRMINWLWRAFDRFFRTFVAKKGYRDGFIGFMIAYYSSMYQIISYAKYWEMRKKLKV